MSKQRSCIIDIESNDFTENLLDFSSFPYKFLPKARLWCIVIRDLDSGEEWFAELEGITKKWLKDTLEPFYYIIAHNGIKFDFLQLQLFGIFDYKIGYIDQPDICFGREVKFLDSLILSRLANPDRGGHSLADWGRRVGELKDNYRQQCIEEGYIEVTDPSGQEFKKYNPLMLPYCKQDCKTNAKAFKKIMEEYRDHDWGDSVQMEHKLADLAVRREFLGFDFDKELGLKCLEELNTKLDDLAKKVEPVIPPKPLNQTELKYWTPPVKQVKQNGELSSHMIKFLSRIEAKCKDDGFVYKEQFYPIPYEKPLKEHVRAEMKDFDHIKMHLISFGWDPIEWSERDMTKDSKKKNLSFEKRVAVLDRWWKDTMNGKYQYHRLEAAKENLRMSSTATDQELYDKLKDKLQEKWPVRVYTAPKIRVGIERDLCPNLIKLGEQVSFARDFADWLTFRHRRNAIAGGEMDEDTGVPSSGFLSAYREIDGRIGTPSIEIGASTGRYTHKTVANIPRASSVYGKEMRSLFRAGKGAVFFGFDYSSLENRIQGSYIFKYPGGPEMAESLVADKPFDSHTKNAEMLGITRSDAKSFTYACLSEDTEVLTTKGFVSINSIKKREKVITYNIEKDILEEDVVLNTVNFKDKEIFEIKSGSFKIKATADHRWYGKQRHSPKNQLKYYSHKFFTTEEINSEKFILNSALYAKKENDLVIDEYEAKLLGYIASDGYLKWSKINPKKTHTERGIDLRITQSENKFIEDIKDTLMLCNLKYNQYIKKEGKNIVYDFVIPQKVARHFLDKVFNCRQNKHNIDWTRFVLSLSTKSRKMFYEGFFNGDGHKEKGKRDRVTQNYGSIYDAITLCCFLEGSYVSHQKKTNKCGVISKQQKRYTTGQKMTKTNLGVQNSYCITTNNSTFVIRQGNTITITGNCLYGAAAPKIAKMLSTDKNTAQDYIDDFWNGNPALNSLKKNLEKYWESKDKKFILGIDKRKIRTRSKHSLLNALFQSGGVIFAKYVSVYLMEKMEKQGLCIDPFVGKPDICSMIEYHDEQDMYANPKLFKFQVFDNEEDAKEFCLNWKGGQLSAISQGKNNKYFISLPSPVSEGIEESIEIVKNRLKISVDMGFEYMIGNNWYECH